MQSDDELIQERLARNQTAFREANERIESTAEGMALLGRVPFICECADPGCTEIVRLSLVEYEQIRQYATRFFNTPGHEILSVDAGASVVVGEMPGCVLVEKVGVAGEIAADDYRNLAN
jgi:hypothetical protein